MARKFVPASTEDFELPLLTVIKDKQFDIEAIRFEESQKGEYAVVKVSNVFKDKEAAGEYRTSAQVVLEQLHQIAKMLNEDPEPVTSLLNEVEGKNRPYLALVDPSPEDSK